MTAASFPKIMALARAGATDQAWMLAETAAREGAENSSLLALKGRLLKDRATRSTGDERRQLYRVSAAAYLRAAELQPATYPMINAAALTLLSGDTAQAKVQAKQVLTLLDSCPEEPETPYWRMATRAEALLLVGRGDEARGAMDQAVGLAPEAWEDHASTLRQFRLILAEQGEDASWLGAYRPPRSMHFGGHMSFDARVARREQLEERIAALLEEEKVGFGYGALAAGADIIVAEALAARGADLHIVLPGGVAAFASLSVDPMGQAWRRRFDALVALAASVRAIRPLGRAPDREIIAIADQVALGMAVMNARRLESEAVQFLVAPAGDERGEMAPPPAGLRQQILFAPREALFTEPPPLAPGTGASLALMVVSMPQPCPDSMLASVATEMGKATPALPPWFTGREVVAAFRRPQDAARIAARLAGEYGFGVGGHFGVTDRVADPFAGTERPAGEALRLASGAAASAPSGTVCLTADFAAVLAASTGGAATPALVGELDTPDGPVELFALDHLRL